MAKRAANVKKSRSVGAKATRMRKLTKSQQKAKAKRDARKRKPLPGSFRLTWQVIRTLRKFWKPLAAIVLVYLILNIVFASGISNLNSAVSNIKLDFGSGGSNSPLSSAISGFVDLIATSGTSSSSTGSVLQSVLVVLESLVIIWALRHLLAGKTITTRQAYYDSTGQLVPFLIILGLIIVQLLPLGLGSALANAVLQSIFVSGGALPVTIFSIVFLALAAWSFYMLSSSIFALYIVTLPGIWPRRALKSAKSLVRFRRWQIMRRLLFLPIFIVLVMCALVVPLIIFATFLVAPVFYLLSMLSILFIHTYLYSLYRGLIE